MKHDGEIHNLTGIRAIAAFWVVLLHAQHIEVLSAQTWLHATPFINRGYLAVDLFFVLSGFIIPYVYHQKFAAVPTLKTYEKYLLLRWARLYPNHFVIFLLYVGLMLAAAAIGKPLDSEGYSGTQALAHLLLIQAWPLGIGLGWNWPSWSISAEFFAYSLLFPAYAWLLRKNAPVWFMLLLLLVLWLLAWGYGQWSGHGFRTFHSGLLRIAPEFLAGYLLFLYSRRRSLASYANILVASSILGLIGLSYIPESWEILALPLLGGLILGLYYGSPLLDRLFGNNIMVYFGHTSYALYMIHNLVNIVFGQGAKMLLGDTPLTGLSAAGFMVALAVASLIAASLCFHLIENPCRQWMKRYLAKSKENSY